MTDKAKETQKAVLKEETTKTSVHQLKLGQYLKPIGNKYKGMTLEELEEYFSTLDPTSDKFIKELYALQQAAIEA